MHAHQKFDRQLTNSAKPRLKSYDEGGMINVRNKSFSLLSNSDSVQMELREFEEPCSSTRSVAKRYVCVFTYTLYIGYIAL